MCRSIEEMLNENAKEVAEKTTREFAIRMIDAGKIPLQEIAEYTGLDFETVKQLASEMKK